MPQPPFSTLLLHPNGDGFASLSPSLSRKNSIQQSVIFEGWILKKRRKRMQGFARRYFILLQSGLLSYSFGPGQPTRDEIFLPRAAISTAPGRKDIHIDSPVITFHLKCLSIEDFTNWMAAFRRFIVTDVQRASTVRTPRLANWGFVRLGVTVEEMGTTISELEDSILAMRSELPQKKERGAPKKSKSEKDKHGGHSKEAAALFALFKKSGNHASTGDSVTEDSGGDASHPLSDASLPERVQITLDKLKAQHAGLLKALQILSLSEASQSASQTPVLPAIVKEEEEDDIKTPILGFSPITRLTKRSSITTSFSDTVSEWFDAQDNFDGAQEFVLDAHPSPIEMDRDRTDSHDSHSSLELPGPGTDTDVEEAEAESSADVPSNIELDKPSQVVRRSRLAAGPVGDEGSLFAILKKNVGKDLSTISFPVTFNEPLTLLQRLGEEVEYYDLLQQAAATVDPVERLCYIAAFAVSTYAHTRFRTGRKGFSPMLAETFEDVRMKFIAEKVQHHPLVMAYHAEGEGWELYATSAGKTRFWGKSLEIIPLGTTHVKIGSDHFEWKKPSSFVRNLMMGTKYLEHCGKMLIENADTKVSCTLDFKQGGMWTASNTVSGTIYSQSGDVIAGLEGKWDEQLSQTVDSSNYRILWRVNTYPKDAQDFYGFTSFGITLNEITSDLEGFLPPTDSRYRPDVRALEGGDLDRAEAEKLRVEEMQRERRRLHADREPRWFRQVGDEWVYSGGYWEERAQGWKGAKIDRLW